MKELVLLETKLAKPCVEVFQLQFAVGEFDMVVHDSENLSIDKYFMPSVANVIGTDLSKYKLISKGLFAYNPMHAGCDERLPVALYSDDLPVIVSPACPAHDLR